MTPEEEVIKAELEKECWQKKFSRTRSDEFYRYMKLKCGHTDCFCCHKYDILAQRISDALEVKAK